ncbi:LysE family transporter [Actinoplanes subglobosus]|uniref:LysE family transporter n=1 Tax=Actinoplanes subglobosus TaxID=1547892 RepID=A0ABV8IK00_9ACTN
MSGAFLAGVVAGYGIAVPVGAIGVLIAGLSARTSLRIGAAAGMGAATADGIYALVAVVGGAAVAGIIAPVETPLRWLGAVALLVIAGWTTWGAVRRPVVTAREKQQKAAREKRQKAAREKRQKAAREQQPEAAREQQPEAAREQQPEAAREQQPEAAREQRPGTAREKRLAAAGERPAAAGGGRSSAVRDGRPATALRAYTGVLALTLLNPATVIYFAALVLGSGGAGGGVWFVTGAFLASASWQLLIAGGGSLIGRVLTSDRGRLITTLVSSAVIASLAVSLLIT